MSGDPAIRPPREILDLVWDALLQEPTGGPSRTVGELLLACAEVADVDHIITVAIATYIEHTTGSESLDPGAPTDSP